MALEREARRIERERDRAEEKAQKYEERSTRKSAYEEEARANDSRALHLEGMAKELEFQAGMQVDDPRIGISRHVMGSEERRAALSRAADLRRQAWESRQKAIEARRNAAAIQDKPPTVRRSSRGGKYAAPRVSAGRLRREFGIP